MKYLQKFIILLCLTTYYIGSSQTNQLQEAFTKKYETQLQTLQEGISLLIKKKGEIYKASIGISNLHNNSVFNIGSATKTFTAILIMQEVEKGTLKLSDTIGTFLSPIQHVDPSLTIKSLLQHQSGLYEVVGSNIETIFYAKSDSIYNKSILDEIKKNIPKNIGSFHYSNTNYLLLGKILENINDQNYFDLLTTRIIEPLGLKRTYPYLSKSIQGLATPYHRGKDVTEYLDHRFFADIANAAGSIASTLSDMEIFYTSLFETELLLKKETFQQMIPKEDEEYGLGLMKLEENGVVYYGHGGNNIGYAFRNGYNPVNGNLFVLFSNSIRIPFKKSIQKDILAYAQDRPIEDFQNINLKEFQKYAGKFFLKEANLTLELSVEEDKMFLIVKEQGIKSELKQQDDSTLLDTIVGITLAKVKENDDELTFRQNGFKTNIKRIH